MEPLEVIDLSSDDEKSSPKKQVSKSPLHMENEIDVKNDEDIKILYNTVSKNKRTIDSKSSNFEAKKIKLSENNKTRNQIKKLKTRSENSALLNGSSGKISANQKPSVKENTNSLHSVPSCSKFEISPKSTNKDSLNIKGNRNGVNLSKKESHVENKQKSPDTQQQLPEKGKEATSAEQMKPRLVVKNRIQISESSDTSLARMSEKFNLFLELCQTEDPGSDMKKIIAKLKKRFKNLEPFYAKSKSFLLLINRKIDLIAHNNSKLYVHIAEVMDEMKARQVINKPLLIPEIIPVEPEEIEDSTQSKTDEASIESPTNHDEEAELKDTKESRKLRAIEKAMRICQRYIKKCETAEVDFDDENNSYYVMAEKYKLRMVNLYNKYCEITGEKKDAARPYLKPKTGPVTPLPSLNEAIKSFINAKILKMNNLKPNSKSSGAIRLTDALVFPDYQDILSCIKRCNMEQKLQLTNAKQENIAKKAFLDLGEHLKRCRQNDYYDTFSLFLEQEDSDPALKDENLAEKLRKNKEIGKKNLDQVFETFVQKQNAITISESGSCLEELDGSEDLSHNSSGDSESHDSDETKNDQHVSKEDNNADSNKNHETNTDPTQDLSQIDDEIIKLNACQKCKEKKYNLISPSTSTSQVEKADVVTNRPDTNKEARTEKIVEPQEEKDTNVELSKTALHQSEVNCQIPKQTKIDVVSNEAKSLVIMKKKVPLQSLTKKPASLPATSKITSTSLPTPPEIDLVDNIVSKSEVSCPIPKQTKIDVVSDEAKSLVNTQKKVPLQSLTKKPASLPATSKITSTSLPTPPEIDLVDNIVSKSEVSCPIPKQTKIDVVSDESKSLVNTQKKVPLQSLTKKPASLPATSKITSTSLPTTPEIDLVDNDVSKSEVSCPIPKQTKIDVVSDETKSLVNTKKQVPLQSLTKKPASLPATSKITSTPLPTTPEIDLVDNDVSTSPTKAIEVIDILIEATNTEKIEKQEEKRPVLSLRPFAKPPDHWEDFQAPNNSTTPNKTTKTTDTNIKEKEITKVIPGNCGQSELAPLNTNILRTQSKSNNSNSKKRTIILPRLDNTINSGSGQNVTSTIKIVNVKGVVRSKPQITSVLSPGVNVPLSNVGTAINLNPQYPRQFVQVATTSNQQNFVIKNSITPAPPVCQYTTRTIQPTRYKLIAPKTTSSLTPTTNSPASKTTSSPAPKTTSSSAPKTTSSSAPKTTSSSITNTSGPGQMTSVRCLAVTDPSSKNTTIRIVPTSQVHALILPESVVQNDVSNIPNQ